MTCDTAKTNKYFFNDHTLTNSSDNCVCIEDIHLPLQAHCPRNEMHQRAHTETHTHTIIHTLLYTESKKTKLARQEKIRTYSASVDNSPKLKTIVQSWKQLSNMTKKPNINTKQKTLTHTIQTDTEL